VWCSSYEVAAIRFKGFAVAGFPKTSPGKILSLRDFQRKMLARGCDLAGKLSLLVALNVSFLRDKKIVGIMPLTHSTKFQTDRGLLV